MPSVVEGIGIGLSIAGAIGLVVAAAFVWFVLAIIIGSLFALGGGVLLILTAVRAEARGKKEQK